MKKLSFWAVLVLLVYGFAELFSYGGLYFLRDFRGIRYEPIDTISAKHRKGINRFIEQKNRYIIFSPTLGWSIKKKAVARNYQVNSAAIRSDREYALIPPSGVRRIAAFGDSFTHCDDVKNHETWQAVLERADTGLEVLNFGVSGFGLDQAYLRYLEEGVRYKAGIVLIGFMSENIKRHVNVYRPFYYPPTGLPLTKPRYIIADGRLTLVPNPMKTLDDYKTLLRTPRETSARIGAHDYFYQQRYASSAVDWSPTVRLTKILANEYRQPGPDENIILNGRYNENAEAFRVTRKLFDEFHRSSRENRALPIVLVFPDKGDVKRYRKAKQKSYAPLLTYFDATGYKYIDLMGAFENTVVEDLFDGHYSPLANRLVAKYILGYLNKIESSPKEKS